MNKKARLVAKNSVYRVLLIAYGIVVIVPFLMLVINCFKTNEEFYANVWALPSSLSLFNFVEAFERANMGRYIFNSVFVSVMGVALNLMLGAMVSYVIARRMKKHANKLYNLYLVGLLAPQIVSIIPQFFMARYMGLFDTLWILILSYAAMELPFCVFTLTAFFKSLPGELDEAATIDGASPATVFTRIMLPLARAGLITVGVFVFLSCWSEYTRALAFIGSDHNKTISLAIMIFRPVSGFKVDWGVLCAACVIFILPVIVVYAFAQRRLIDGLTAGSVKG